MNTSKGGLTDSVSDMGIREKIQQKCERIAASVADHGRSDGTEIATQEEMHWLALQMALRGVLFSYSADESTYQNGDEIYYYYWAISASEKRDKVDDFLRCYPVLSANELDKLYILDDSRQYDNVKLVRRQVMRRDRQRRQREKKERLEQEAWEREQREEEEREAAMQEAYEHRDDLTWLVSRIESLGWEVTLKRKTTD